MEPPSYTPPLSPSTSPPLSPRQSDRYSSHQGHSYTCLKDHLEELHRRAAPLEADEELIQLKGWKSLLAMALGTALIFASFVPFFLMTPVASLAATIGSSIVLLGGLACALYLIGRGFDKGYQYFEKRDCEAAFYRELNRFNAKRSSYPDRDGEEGATEDLAAFRLYYANYQQATQPRPR